MHFRQLETFVTVYETKSFAASARSLFVSQPAVSQQIRSLEEEIGFPLFARNRHSVVPTEQGERFYPYVKRLLVLQGEALSALRPDSPAFRLHFVAGDFQDPIRQVQLRFYADFPGVRIEILPPVPQEWFSDTASLDPGHLYIVRRSWIRDDRIRFYPLGQARYSALLSREDFLASLKEIGFPDLGNRHVLVLPNNLYHGPFMGFMMKQIREYVPAERIIICSDQLDALSRLLNDRSGSVFIIPFFVQTPPEERIRRVSFLPAGEDDPIGLAFVGQANPAMSRFIRMADGCYRSGKTT